MRVSESFEALAAELEALFTRGVDEPLSDEAFGELALRVFVHQVEASPTYAAFCAARGVSPQHVVHWREVPPVPASGFKHVKLLAAPGAEAVFTTSGTTKGSATRGRHFVPRLSLYRASLLPPFRRWVLPEGKAFPLLSLIPSPSDTPESSLSYMVGTVSRQLASETRWLADGSGLANPEDFSKAVAEAIEDGDPLLIVGTAFGLVHLLDRMRDTSSRMHLPEGTRIMETGGFKGRSREASRASLRRAMEERLGVQPGFVVSEYGMTELLSQLYEPILSEGVTAAGLYLPPPWLRVRAVDPMTLEDVGMGHEGLLCFHDLANLGSVSVVLTEDVGTVDIDGVRLRGRAAGSEPRGCSLAVEDLLSARDRAG
jgi:hypothetical protein